MFPTMVISERFSIKRGLSPAPVRYYMPFSYSTRLLFSCRQRNESRIVPVCFFDSSSWHNIVPSLVCDCATSCPRRCPVFKVLLPCCSIYRCRSIPVCPSAPVDQNTKSFNVTNPSDLLPPSNGILLDSRLVSALFLLALRARPCCGALTWIRVLASACIRQVWTRR